MFTIKRKINFFDCDPAGIIFYSRIFEFSHSAYEQLISSFNLKENYWMNEDYVVPIIHSESEYVKPIKYGDEISINIEGLTALGRSQLLHDSAELLPVRPEFLHAHADDLSRSHQGPS